MGKKTLDLSETTNKTERRFWGKIVKSDGCWQWLGSKEKHGYGKMFFKKGMPPIIASRLSWFIHFGEIPNNLHVLHKCDNPECCNPEHLFLGTAKDNAQDMIKKGRKPPTKPRYGKDNLATKFSYEDVFFIRENFGYVNTTEMAKSFGVHTSSIVNVFIGKTHNKGEYIPDLSRMRSSLLLPRPYRSKLKPTEITEVVKLYKFGGFSSRALAKAYRINKTSILKWSKQ